MFHRRSACGLVRGSSIARNDFSFDLLRDFGKRRATVGGRELDAAVFWRIMRGCEMDDAIGLIVDDRMGQRWGGGGFGDHQRRDSVCGQDFRRH
jgi:hypothetical protein